jgi:ribosomal protection tetracycline resistance protein
LLVYFQAVRRALTTGERHDSAHVHRDGSFRPSEGHDAFVHLLNLGILAHVDAGKTSLTERLLFDAGVTDEIGRVDDGSTQTDTLALERERGITIKAAVVSFAIGDLTVNLIDTPGHPDFIAEVERSLRVLDGAVLVISAVEGVQAQTRVLMRALRRLRIPTVIFVNKIDRGGAGYDRLLADIAARLSPAIVAMGALHDLGTTAAAWEPYGPADPGFADRLADVLTLHDDVLLADYLAHSRALAYRRLRSELADQTGKALVYPVYFGSAITGAGIGSLTAGLAELLPVSSHQADTGNARGRGTVFKVERGVSGEKVAYVRMFEGTAGIRKALRYGAAVGEAGKIAKVTGISVFNGGPAIPAESVQAGQIAKLWGLADVRVGDAIGEADTTAPGRYFAPPTLQTVVAPARAADRPALHAALSRLAEQDPLINLHQDAVRHELLVSLYGEVQKEVLQATLAAEFGIEVGFMQTSTICIERLAAAGAAAEFMGDGSNPFKATIGLRLSPAPPGSGMRFQLEIERGALPSAFLTAIEETASQTLAEGLWGWAVPDCVVTVTHSGYVPPPPQGWSKFSSSAADFRRLTPLVVMAALKQARTIVCEPVSSFRLDIPQDSVTAVLTALARLGAMRQAPGGTGAVAGAVITGEIPSGRLHELQQQLPGLTGGEGVLESEFARYQQVSGDFPVRRRTDHS